MQDDFIQSGCRQSFLPIALDSTISNLYLILVLLMKLGKCGFPIDISGFP